MRRIALLSSLLPLLASCTTGLPTAPTDAPSPAPSEQAYLALGTEPFWSLEITPQWMTFHDMERRMTRVATPRVIHGIAGEIYNTPTLSANIVHTDCSDGMSDRVYPDRVQLTVRGQRFEGCGGEPITLQERGWRIRSIDGVALPTSTRAATMRFEGERLSASVGCNQMSAPYTVRRGQLTPGAVASTRMGCPPPVATLEARVAAILAEPLTVRGTSSGGYTLTNRLGRIELARGE